MPIPAITGFRAVTAPRLSNRVLHGGSDDGVPVVFVHGHVSAATWCEETMLRLAPGFRALAPDLRGYGGADPAARGLADLSDDRLAPMEALGIGVAISWAIRWVWRCCGASSPTIPIG